MKFIRKRVSEVPVLESAMTSSPEAAEAAAEVTKVQGLLDIIEGKGGPESEVAVVPDRKTFEGRVDALITIIDQHMTSDSTEAMAMLNTLFAGDRKGRIVECVLKRILVPTGRINEDFTRPDPAINCTRHVRELREKYEEITHKPYVDMHRHDTVSDGKYPAWALAMVDYAKGVAFVNIANHEAYDLRMYQKMCAVLGYEPTLVAQTVEVTTRSKLDSDAAKKLLALMDMDNSGVAALCALFKDGPTIPLAQELLGRVAESDRVNMIDSHVLTCLGGSAAVKDLALKSGVDDPEVAELCTEICDNNNERIVKAFAVIQEIMPKILDLNVNRVQSVLQAAVADIEDQSPLLDGLAIRRLEQSLLIPIAPFNAETFAEKAATLRAENEANADYLNALGRHIKDCFVVIRLQEGLSIADMKDTMVSLKPSAVVKVLDNQLDQAELTGEAVLDLTIEEVVEELQGKQTKNPQLIPYIVHYLGVDPEGFKGGRANAAVMDLLRCIQGIMETLGAEQDQASETSSPDSPLLQTLSGDRQVFALDDCSCYWENDGQIAVNPFFSMDWRESGDVELERVLGEAPSPVPSHNSAMDSEPSTPFSPRLFTCPTGDAAPVFDFSALGAAAALAAAPALDSSGSGMQAAVKPDPVRLYQEILKIQGQDDTPLYEGLKGYSRKTVILSALLGAKNSSRKFGLAHPFNPKGESPYSSFLKQLHQEMPQTPVTDKEAVARFLTALYYIEACPENGFDFIELVHPSNVESSGEIKQDFIDIIMFLRDYFEQLPGAKACKLAMSSDVHTGQRATQFEKVMGVMTSSDGTLIELMKTYGVEPGFFR